MRRSEIHQRQSNEPHEISHLKVFENSTNKQNITYTPDKTRISDQIKDQMDGTCGMHGGNEQHNTF
jgi:hypothetical protein